MRSCLPLCVLCGVLGVASCADVEGGVASRLGLALTVPAANASEVRSLGFFAMSLTADDFDCGSYLSGERNPIAQDHDLLVAVDYQDVDQGSDDQVLTFRAVPEGELSIMVEAYDVVGSRIFLGCEQIRVVAGQSNPIEMTLVEDPIAP
jgi:hypothetical protein